MESNNDTALNITIPQECYQAAPMDRYRANMLYLQLKEHLKDNALFFYNQYYIKAFSSLDTTHFKARVESNESTKDRYQWHKILLRIDENPSPQPLAPLYIVHYIDNLSHTFNVSVQLEVSLNFQKGKNSHHTISHNQKTEDELGSHNRTVFKPHIIELYITTGHKPYWSHIKTKISLPESTFLRHDIFEWNESTSFSSDKANQAHSQRFEHLIQQSGSTYESHRFICHNDKSYSSHYSQLCGAHTQQRLQQVELKNCCALANRHFPVSIEANHSQLDQIIHAWVGSKSGVNLQSSISTYPNTQNNVASFMAKSILLHKSSKSTLGPHLNIQSPEIDCRHSAHVGTIDAHLLDYLQSKGLKKQQVHALLLQSELESFQNTTPAWLYERMLAKSEWFMQGEDFNEH